MTISDRFGRKESGESFREKGRFGKIISIRGNKGRWSTGCIEEKEEEGSGGSGAEGERQDGARGGA